MHQVAPAIIKYDALKYGLAAWASEALKVKDLVLLHQRVDLKRLSFVDAIAHCRKELSNKFNLCEEMFREFIENEVVPKFGGQRRAYQIPPMFRVHLNECPTVSAFHRDREYGMPPGRLNVWIPLTRVWGGNSLWIQNGNNEFEPINLQYGEALVFDSANVLHGSVMNDTGYTRVSMDCRFISATTNPVDLAP